MSIRELIFNIKALVYKIIFNFHPRRRSFFKMDKEAE